jgi:4-amino-4-deoxy-L-arabinose transferase-like glycosyltransferase
MGYAAPRLAGALDARRLVLPALGAILAVGAALRVATAADPGRFLSADERAYSALGIGLADHASYASPRLADPFHWPPGTPVLLALARLIGGDATRDGNALNLAPGYWAHAVVGIALIGAVYVLARAIAGPGAGLAAAAVVAFYPPLITVTGDLVSEPLGALTLTLALLALVRAQQAPTTFRLAGAGALLGVAVLVRADLLVIPFALAIGLATWLWARRGAKTGLEAGAAFLYGALLLIVPWSVWASHAAGRLIPVTDGGSSALYVATYLPGGGTMSGLKRELAAETRRDHPRMRRLSASQIPAELVLDTVARREGGPSRAAALQRAAFKNLVRYGLGDPLDFSAMTGRKLWRMWGGYYRGTYHNTRSWLLALHLLVVPVALVGAVLGAIRARSAPLAMILGVIVLATLVNAFFVAEARHNLRLLPALIAAGASGYALLLSRSRSGARA